MTKNTTAEDLRLGTSRRDILKVAMPIALALLAPQLIFIFNTYFLSQLGEVELAAAGITGICFLVFSLIGNGLNSGLQALISRRAGEERPEEIGRMFAQSIWIALLFALGSILIIYTLGEWFLGAAIENPEIQKISRPFLNIIILELPCLYIFQMGNALLVGTNNSKYLKYGFLVLAICTVFFDYSLIFGHFGLPKLGFMGAAYASIIATTSATLTVFSIIFYKQLHRKFSLFTEMKFNPSLSGLIFKQSSPLVMQFVLSIGAWLLFYILIENSGKGLEHSERPLAISQTMRTIFSLFGVFVWAFASASNAMVSNIIGQNRKEEVMGLIRKIASLSFFFTLSLCLIINLIPYSFLGLFNADKDFLNEAIPVVRIVSVALLFMSVCTTWLNGVTGTANTKMNLLIELVAILFYSIYVYLVISVWKMPLTWAWASEFLYWGVIGTMAWVYLKSGKWKAKQI